MNGSQSRWMLNSRMKRRPVKKVGREKPRNATVVAAWSKIEHGRSAAQSGWRLNSRMKRSPVKKVGREKPMNATGVAAWSKIEYGRSAEYVPMGIAIRMARTSAEPRTNSVTGILCKIRVSTLTRLTKEKPQSPRIIDTTQRAYAR